MSLLNDLKFRWKIILSGVNSIFLTVVVIVGVVLWQVSQYEQEAVAKANELTTINLQNITQGIYNLVEAQHEAVQQQVNHNLNVAKYIVAQAGGISLQYEVAQWTAVNQLNQQKVEVNLPQMYAGDTKILANSSLSEESPIVDTVVWQVGGTATIFQRMNDAGDMLRVATTVQTQDGKRAVGTYIPAKNPDGAANPVITAVLNKETYHGMAYVLDSWYVTAYEPIYNHQNEVVGMLYVGVQQESITSLRRAIQQAKVGKTGRIYVINGRGEARGRYIISPDGTRDGQSAWLMQDAAGGYPVQAIIEKALALDFKDIAQVRYPWQDEGASAVRWKVNQVTYFEPWDWVIVSEVYEDELMEYQQALAQGHNRLLWTIMLAALGIVLVVSLISWLFARTITRSLDHLTGVAGRIAAGDLSAAAQLRGRDEAGLLARAFNEMTGRLRELLSAEQAQRQRLESTVQVYVEHLERVTQGDLLARVSLNGGAQAAHHDALELLGEQLNVMTASLQQMIEQIRDAANNLSSASAEILAVTVQQSSGAGEQSAAIAQTTTTVEQVRAIAEAASLRAQEVAGTARQTLDISRAGQQAVQDSFASMEQIRGRVREINGAIRDLSNQTRQIGQIIATVNDIAAQSNLLALNAAVEAARAGEAGEGFAVVAGEVRSLADQSRQATEQVRGILASIQKAIQAAVAAAGEGESRVESGVQLASRTGESIEVLSAAIREAVKTTEQLSAGGLQQRAGIDQIVQAMHQINQATTQNLASTRQAELSAQALDALAKELAGTVGKYRI